ncbi:hypothetical protein CI109_102592 [Kwoniella shandongensis]|uniref:Uncharacterized protein n=1 Tax=Kwoniella shandongensis TaxID=1734106 RepID=A0A5M6BU78_9TREE|nr:uncharacterized protein CI109_005173 [Kwoniella shandongensis]KAA5526404.1 hypothetical protein CI109_005173 [Kwoniella shandongensis]
MPAKKRSAPSSAAEPSTKKSKSASTTPKPKSKGKSVVESATDSPLQTVKQAATDLIQTVSDAVDVAGDLIFDDGNTPAPVSQVIEENVDVPALKKKGKAAKGKAVEAATDAAIAASDKVTEAAKPLKGKAAKAAKDAGAAVESTIEGKTGVDVKAAKGKATKAAKAAKENIDAATAVVQPEVEKAVEAAKPLKGKAAKAAAAAQAKVVEGASEVEKAAKDPKNRKKAEDFMTQAEETVKKVVGDVAGKVSEVMGEVVSKFGEASGLTADLGGDAKKVQDKAKAVVEDGKKQAGKKGKQVVEKAEQVVEDGKKQAGKKGKQLADKAGEVVEEGKKQAGKKGKEVAKKAEEVVEEGKKQAGKKGKQVVEEAKETGKRKAKDAVAAAEPSVKKAKSAIPELGATIESGKKAAAKTAGKATKAVVDTVEDVAGSDDDEDDASYIHGFSSSDGEGDSSDDESDAEDLAVAEAGRKIDMSTLPSVAKDDKSVQARLKKASRKKDEPKGTLFLGRIPHGFYEEQMKEYFSQFGDVSRVRLARNRKTGASKHYAYIEMPSVSVAEIVAETMNNYLLMGHLLKCQVVPLDQVHPQLWVGANKKFRKVPRARVEKMKHDKPRTDEEQVKADKKLKKKESQRKKNIKGQGIDYEFDGHA